MKVKSFFYYSSNWQGLVHLECTSLVLSLHINCLCVMKVDNFSVQISAAALSTDGKTLILAETEQIYVWNFPHRAILSANPEPDVKQILFTSDQRRFLTVSHKVQTGPLSLVETLYSNWSRYCALIGWDDCFTDTSSLMP